MINTMQAIWWGEGGGGGESSPARPFLYRSAPATLTFPIGYSVGEAVDSHNYKPIMTQLA